MDRSYKDILSPAGEQASPRQPEAVVKGHERERPVIGLINNSKPNVSFFLEAIEKELLSQGAPYQVLWITKPRSAGACPDIDRLAARCDYAISAVAD